MTLRKDSLLKNINDPQSIEVDAATFARHHVNYPDDLWHLPADGPQNLLDCFECGLKKVGPKGKFLGVYQGDVPEPYIFKTFGDVQEEAKQLAGALALFGLQPGKDFLGIFSSNNYQYDTAIIGGYYRNIANVSLYDTLGADAVEYICKQTEVRVMLIEDIKKLKMVLSFDSNIETIILLNNSQNTQNTQSSQDTGTPSKEGVNIISWEDALAIGQKHGLEEIRPSSGDTATINYTSGTTGNPKGVVLTQKAMTTNGVGAFEVLIPYAMDSTDMYYSYLPLAHIFERLAHVMLMYGGIPLCYSSGDIKNLLPELQIVKPTLFIAVPRVLNKIYDRVMALREGSCIKNLLLGKATAAKRAYLNQGTVTQNTWWDTLVLKKVAALLGGRVKSIVCGAAPLDPKVRGLIRELFGCYFIEGYGQTENAAAGCAATFVNWTVEDGFIGPPTPWSAMKLKDVPDMNYFAKDGKGEICFKGDGVMKEYFKAPEKTAEALDEDGWLMTGDVGTWSKNGMLKIIDRKKHIYKLAQGEYIAPERLEGIYLKHPLVAQMFIWGNSLYTYNVAVVVPEPDGFAKIGGDSKKLLEEISKYARAEGMKGFEVVKKIHIETDMFSVENDLLTPTQKAKRPKIQAKYQDILQKLYD